MVLQRNYCNCILIINVIQNNLTLYVYAWATAGARVSRLPPPPPPYYVRGFLLLFIPGGGLFWVCPPPPPYENFCGRPMYMYINAVYILYKVVQYLLHIDKLQYSGERCRV